MATPPGTALRRRRLALGAAALAVAVAISGIVFGAAPRAGRTAAQPSAKASSATGSPADIGSPKGPTDLASTGAATTTAQHTADQNTAVAGPGNPPAGNVLPAGFSIRAGKAAAPSAPNTPVVAGQPLPSSAVAQILGRLPAWTTAPELAQDFRWPAQSLTKPAPGKTITQPFPAVSDNQRPPTPPPATPTGPLTVLRMQPQGSVSVAPFVSITFSQPMVAVGTVGQLRASKPPAVISPAVPGRWDWLGTTTLRFTADSATVDRLPMATKFTVTVPGGTRSAGGNALSKPATATFTTPPPAVTGFTPTSKSVPLRPVVVAVFNQRVDPAAVLATTAVTAGGRDWPVRIATPAEIAADKDADVKMSAAPRGRTVALVPARDFPAATAIRVTFKAGTASAEGPLRNTRAAGFGFSTYPPMQLRGAGCAWGPQCPPGSPFLLTFSNPIDPLTFDKSSVTVTPAVPGGVSIDVSGSQVTISGATRAATTYAVTVAPGLKDTFGQRLARSARAPITTGHASTGISPFPGSVTTLDPTAAGPTVTITSVNQPHLRERVFAVQAQDWPSYLVWRARIDQRGQYRAGDDLSVPGWPVLTDRVVPVPGSHDQVSSLPLSLSSAMSGARRQVVVLIEPVDPQFEDYPGASRPTLSWVQSTHLGIDAVTDRSTLRTWVTDLRTGAPVAGVTVAQLDARGRPTDAGTATDAHGQVAQAYRGVVTGLIVTKGDDTARLPTDNRWAAPSSNVRRDQLLWYVTDDRQTYRPGETVSVKGWVRRQADDTTLALTRPAAAAVPWSVTDSTGIRLAAGKAAVDGAGGFDLTLAIPAGAHLGPADLHLDLHDTKGVDNTGFDHQFTVADFRTPAFSVDTHTGTTPAVRGANLPVQADATYYAGGPVGKAPVAWQVRTATASYAPPGWNNYTFGIWTPWWYSNPSSGNYSSGPAYGAFDDPNQPGPERTVQKFTGTTDGNGSASLDVTVGRLGSDSDGLPVTVLAQATVTDVNRQQIAGTADVLVHPSYYYVGLSSDATFVKAGEKLTVAAIATTIDGTLTAGRPITLTAARVTNPGSPVDGRNSDPSLADPQTCTITSGAAPVTCTFTPTVGGEYRITALVTDENGRTSRTQLTRWVAGPDGSVDTTVAQQSLTLVPDAKQYRPGQSARLLVSSPITTGTGLITVSHNGILSTETFAVTGGSAVVPVAITAAAIPGLTATVEVVGTVPRGGTGGNATAARPAYATGQIDLDVSTASRSLTVTAKPRQATVKPGGKTTLDVRVQDPAGKPVSGSTFEVVVVDEAVLALGGGDLPDPLDAFYPRNRNEWSSWVYGRSLVMLGTPPSSASSAPGRGSSAMSSAAAAMSGGAAAGSVSSLSESASASSDAAAAAPPSRAPVAAGRAVGAAPTTPITQRSVFKALALFAPTVTTGADGTASIPVTLPDNLTRYRITVVAVAGNNEFGVGESSVTAGLPLTVRPSPPRFLNFGDHAELPVVVQNLTDTPISAGVILQAGNLTVTGAGSGATAQATGKQVTVPARGRVEVRFPVRAEQAGTARFRVAAVSGDDADAAEQEFPVYTPSTSETFATYGNVPEKAVTAQQISKPTGVLPSFGSLQISTSSTALAQLTDAVHYVVDYQYRSADALAGQILAIASVGDVLQAFSAPGLPAPGQLKALVDTDIGKLIALQNKGGGFSSWQPGDDVDAFTSVLAVQALLVADKQGFAAASHAAVAQAIKQALPYLAGIEAELPAHTSAATRDTMNAFALSVRARAGVAAAAGAADALVGARGSALPLDAVAWLLPLVSGPQRQLLLTRVRNAAVDDAGSVTFTEKVTDDAWTVLHSDTRTDALILDALLAVSPKSDLIAKTVTGLLGQQRGGRWDNLQANAFTLLALRRYYDTYEAATPDFVAAVWLGNTFAGQHRYTGRTAEQSVVNIPISAVLAHGDTSITVADQGSGRMYYRIGLTTAPADLTVAALDRGFTVIRSYAGADNHADVTRDGKGVWHVKAGARVRVTLTMVSRSAQSHVALADPLPAGLEALNPALATTSKDLAGANANGGNADPFSWTPTWYDHQDLRDDRAEAYANYLPGGVYSYSYLAAATTPGSFVVPPTTANQIYAPETFGRAGTDRVVITG